MLNLPKRAGVDRLDEIEDVLWNAESASERIAREIQNVLKNKKGVYTGDRMIDYVLMMTIGTDISGTCRDSVNRAIHGVKHLEAMRDGLKRSRGELVLKESIENKEWVLEYGFVAEKGDVLYLGGISTKYPAMWDIVEGKPKKITDYYMSLRMFINTGNSHKTTRYADVAKLRNRSLKGDMPYHAGDGTYLFGKEAEERLGMLGAAKKLRRSR